MHPRTSSSGLVVFAILHHVSLALGAIFLAASFIDGPRDLWRVFAFLFAIPAAVFGTLILYRGWSAVQDGSAQTSPGKAVGFCFIPFFNLYWNFVAYVGLMKEFNRLAEARGRQDQKVNEGIAMTICVLSATLCLSSLAAPFGVVFIWQTIGAVKDLENS
jgi:ABC-type Mn2+/Zn2+ transport system permease subunit